MRLHELSDFEKIVELLLYNKPRGVLRVSAARGLNGMLGRLRTGSPWHDIPERYGLSTTCYNRIVRWFCRRHIVSAFQLLRSRPQWWRTRCSTAGILIVW